MSNDLTIMLENAAPLEVFLHEGTGQSGTRNYNNLINKPSINGVTISGDLSAADLRFISENTEAGWISNPTYIPKRGELCIYTDTLAIKVGDGIVPIVDLPYMCRDTSEIIPADRIADLPASKITSGTFDGARIPNLDASKISSGILSSDRLPASGVIAGSYGPSSNASPTHGSSFSVPTITTDATGRIINASTKTITLPTYSTASSSENGLMSATDKSKLDSMTTVPLVSGIIMTEGTDGLMFTYVN